MGQSRSTVRTTDQSKAWQLGGGTGFFSTHKPTVRTARVACPGNLAALKPPLLESPLIAWLYIHVMSRNIPGCFPWPCSSRFIWYDIGCLCQNMANGRSGGAYQFRWYLPSGVITWYKYMSAPCTHGYSDHVFCLVLSSCVYWFSCGEDFPNHTEVVLEFFLLLSDLCGFSMAGLLLFVAHI